MFLADELGKGARPIFASENEVTHLDALRHRVGLTYEAEAEETTTDQILLGVLDRIPVPAGY